MSRKMDFKGWKPRKDDLEKSWKLRKEGNTLKHIAQMLGISDRTLRKWKEHLHGYWVAQIALEDQIDQGITPNLGAASTPQSLIQAKKKKSPKRAPIVLGSSPKGGKPKGTCKFDPFKDIDLSYVQRMAIANFSFERIAQNLCLSKNTLIRYCKMNPALDKAVKFAKDKKVVDIVSAMVQRSLGYEYTTKTQILGDDNKPKTLTNTHHAPANVQAGKLMLTNLEGWTNEAKPQKESDNRGAIIASLDAMAE